jgi:CheY-like chemotaxis protein
VQAPVMLIVTSPTTRKILEIGLRRAGLPSIAFSTASEAVQALQAHPDLIPSAIILDVGWRGYDASILSCYDNYQLAFYLRTNPHLQHAGIIALSQQRNTLVQRAKMQLAGIQKTFPKPFRIQDITSCVKTFCEPESENHGERRET